MGLLGKAIADAVAAAAAAAATVAVAFSVAAEIEAAALKGFVVTTVAFVAAAVLAVTGFVATTMTVPAAGAFVRDLLAVQFGVETVSLVVGMSCAMNYYY